MVIYACDMDAVLYTVGYDSSNIIFLADTQVVVLRLDKQHTKQYGESKRED